MQPAVPAPSDPKSDGVLRHSYRQDEFSDKLGNGQWSVGCSARGENKAGENKARENKAARIAVSFS